MNSSDGIVDWNALSLNEGIQLITQVMRGHLGVRVFALTPDGEMVDLTPSDTAGNTVFDHFVRTDALWGDEESRASMVQTRQAWTTALTEEKTAKSDDISIRVETTPGFCAHIVPIYFREEIKGGLVVAGFIAAEKAADGVEAIRAVLPKHLLEAIDEGDNGPTIVQLHRDDRRWLDRLATSMAGHLTEELVRRAPSMVEESATRFCGMLGKSKEMKTLFRNIEKVARTNSTILIAGENGTGKELVARAIHRLSRRRERPFIAVNCAAIPADLIASELFGHVKGAFSGAHRDRKGLFEAADGGTLLLDEIGDMEHSLQTKLLRVLQEGTFLPVGDTEVRNVDVRVLCATNRNLEEMVRQKEFRRDLYFRIRVIKLAIPALRDRDGDVEFLARHFVNASARRHGKKEKDLSSECLRKLSHHDWPGNVRELENEIERLVIMSGDEPEIGSQWLSTRMAEAEEPEPTLDFEGYELPEAIEIVERKMIFEGLQRTGWNKSQTARDLGVSRRNLIRKVARYELEEEREND